MGGDRLVDVNVDGDGCMRCAWGWYGFFVFDEVL